MNTGAMHQKWTKTEDSRARSVRHAVSRRGFTTTEVLIAVGILIVLFGLMAPNLIAMQKNLRQKELDTKAETIYQAVQNQLVKLRATGNASKYEGISSQVIPWDNEDLGDYVPQYDEDGEEIELTYYYVQPGDSVAESVMTSDVVDDGLLGSYWIVEYDPENCSVHAVFYGEQRDVVSEYTGSDSDKYAVTLRELDGRLDDGALVGYYGGNSGSSTSSTSTLKPTIKVTNGEKLTAFLSCTAPSATTTLEFKLTLEDADDHSYTQTITKTSTPAYLTQKGKSFTVTVTLDDLSSAAKRFNYLYGAESSLSSSEQLTPGPLFLTLAVSSTNNGTVESGSTETVSTNSLFADESTTSKAYVAYGRHLQNLDTTSGVPSTITSAVQSDDVSFADNDLSSTDWYSYYSTSFFNGTANSTANFKPIQNDNLTSYDGDDNLISSLNIQVEADDDETANAAALFEHIDSGVTLQNMSLTGSLVTGNASAAALVGRVTGTNNTIEDCRVYLDPNKNEIKGKDEEDLWIDAPVASGLVAAVEDDASLSISKSFASTVIHGSTTAGGLVGTVSSSGTLNLSKSYADSYLTGKYLAGLVGQGNVASMTDCYAAGFQTADDEGLMAGLVNGTIADAQRSYTICAMSTDATDASTYATAPTVTSMDGLYYFAGGDTEDKTIGTSIGNTTSTAFTELLGDAFQSDTSDTVAYNLMGQTLTTYTYPRLVANAHYGDWQADFQVGALVYYEKYTGADQEYGFYGGNVDSTLSSSGVVVGDGYGLVFRASDAVPSTITVTIEGVDDPITLSTSTYYTVTSADDATEYHVIPLPASAVNATPPSATYFYQRVDIAATNTDGTTTTDVYYFNPHFAATAVRMEDTSAERPTLATDDKILVRTPRHLFEMSRFYDSYFATPTQECIFTQQRSMDYPEYDWVNFTTQTATVTEQEPIGSSATSPFVATYNGGSYVITGVSFVSESGSYVGMFGYNEGDVRNVVLATNYVSGDTTYYVKRTNNMTVNERVYMGVLVGYNNAYVYNCAVAGYYVAGSDATIHAYANSHLYVGGLAGGNNATIANCSSDCPIIRLSSVFADVSLGGFVGYNYASGSMYDCYSIGHIEVAYARGGTVRASGFAGRNEGIVSSSYCATSVATSGESATAYGFAPTGGVVGSCYYLDKGTYYYVGELHSYNAVTTRTSGTSVTYDGLVNLRGSATVNKARSYYHANTSTSGNAGFPYRAVVKNSEGSGSYVHYGDWQTTPNMGTMGVFYWEHEEGGTNDGYHITYVGTNGSGTSLCTAHDDGGSITEYGYGYYVKEGQEDDTTLESSGIEVSSGTYNSTAADALEEQLSGFTFYPYTTQVASSGDYVYLNNGESTTGTWTLTYNNSETYTFEIAPFFANAFCRTDASGSIYVTAADGNTTDYSQSPGSDDNPYEIRSLQQLQYANWNYDTMDTSTLVDASTYQQFPYLQYATALTNQQQSSSSAIEAVEEARPSKYWLQTHDLLGDDIENFTPIAGANTSSAWNNRNTTLYGWFGGTFDGQSYKIQNVNIDSSCYTVGLFGTTVGANMSNIIMYSDNESSVRRSTPSATSSSGVGAYSLGGLIGTAFDYDTSTTTNTISNCAIAGYTIDDSSTNRQGLGEANIGGLIGVSNVMLQSCSSVNNIEINCTHDYGCAQYGNYVRVGGLTGAGLGSITDCYAGGSISVGDDTLSELYTSNSGTKRTTQTALNRNYNTHVYVCGISGSTFCSKYVNFKGVNDGDGTVVLSNCYCYTTLPNFEGNIKGVSLIAATADRYSQNGSKVTMSNCHYLADIANISFTQPYYDDDYGYYFTNGNNGTYAFTDTDKTNMLNGNLTVNKKIIQNDGGTSGLTGTPNAVEYDELSATDMSSTLGSNWGWVTTTEPNGASIDGKYSFPGTSKLEGLNYPFPTVIQQNDLTYGTVDDPVMVNVHYGSWPTESLYWETARDTMDIFMDMDTTDTSSDGPYATKTFLLYDPKDIFEGAALDPSTNFAVSETSIAEVTDCEYDSSEGAYVVTVRALSEGAVTVIAKSTDLQTSASMVLTITANLNLSTNPESMETYLNKSGSITLTAESAESDEGVANDFSTASKGTWNIAVNDDDADVITAKKKSSSVPNVWTVTGDEPGSYTLTVTYTYDYHGTTYSSTLLVPLSVLGKVGLSNGSTHNEVKRYTSNATGSDETYSDDAPQLTGSADVTLYSTLSDDIMETLTVESLTVNGSAVTWTDDTGTTEDGAFTVVYEDVTSDTNFQYKGMVVRYLGTDAPEDGATIVATVKDPKSEATYTLTVTLDLIPRYVATFVGNGGSGSTQVVKAYAGSETITLPECGFTQTGYTFVAWGLTADATEGYAAGDTYELTADTTFYALWNPNTYYVAYDANGGEGTMEVQEFTYGVEASLTANAFTLDGYRFGEWNTDAEATGDAYADEETVKNLTSEDGATVTLYAQWAEKYSLTLMCNATSCGSWAPVDGDTTLADYSAPTRTDGWSLEGWYTAMSADADKVLNADGTIANDVDGYTSDGGFSLSADQTLYAKWERTGFVAVDQLAYTSDTDTGNGTYLIVSDDTVGTEYAMAVSSKNNLTYSEVKVLEDDVFDEDGTSHTSYIDAVDDTYLLWDAVYQATVSISNKRQDDRISTGYIATQFDSYTLQNQGSGYYLYRGSPTVSSSANTYYGQFSYGQKFYHGLECRKWCADGGGDTIYWTGSGWAVKSNTPYQIISLYKQQTLYTFE